MELSAHNDFNEELSAQDLTEQEQASPNTASSHALENLSRPDFLSLSRREQMSAVEVLLFASEEPLSTSSLYEILVSGEENDKKQGGTSKNGVVANSSSNEIAHDGINNGEMHNQEAFDAIPHIVYLHAEHPEGMIEQPQSDNNYFAPKPIQSEALIISLIEDLNDELEASGRVFRVIEVAREGSKGFQFATNPEHGEILARLVKSKSKKRLSKAGLETLAIIAYRQPVSKPELEVIRGVSSNEIMNRLLEKNLITIVGRSESVGKPLLYGTTDEFLRLFGLHSIADLPKPRELEELMAERADILEVAQILAPTTESSEKEEITVTVINQSGLS